MLCDKHANAQSIHQRGNYILFFWKIILDSEVTKQVEFLINCSSVLDHTEL